MSVRPHGTTRFPLGIFWWNLIFRFLSEICRENSSFIKIRREQRVLLMKTFSHLWQYLARAHTHTQTNVILIAFLRPQWFANTAHCCGIRTLPVLLRIISNVHHIVFKRNGNGDLIWLVSAKIGLLLNQRAGFFHHTHTNCYVRNNIVSCELTRII